MSIEPPDARTLSLKGLETLRLRAIHARELGYHGYQVAEILGVAPETVSRWWTDFPARGIEAVTSEGKLRFLTYEKAFTADVIPAFLIRLLRGAAGERFVIIDRQQAHDTVAVEQRALSRKDDVELFHMPAKVPELNPDETSTAPQ